MRKNLYIVLFILPLLVSFSAYSTTENEKEKEEEKKEDSSTKITTKRKFQSLEVFKDSAVKPDNLYPKEFQKDLSDTLQQFVDRALELDEYLKNNNRFVEVLDEKTLVDLPVGIKKEIGGLTYSISLDSIVMTPTSAYLIAYMVFEIPSSGKKIAFRGSRIGLTKSGGITGGNARLELIGDQSMNLFSEKSLFTFKGDGNTFVEFDCNGFKSMGIGAEITFSRDVMIPDKESSTDRVTTKFKTTLTNWSDLIVQVDLPPFQITKLDDVGFSVRDAVFDFSDLRNAPAVKFPDGYQHSAIQSGLTELWRGIYIRELSVRLPQQFEQKGSNERPSFAAYNLVIDNMGFSGFLEGKNLISTQNGDMNGWAYSLDSIAISLKANQIEQAGLKGDIIVPINKEDTPFEYTGIINPGSEYLFNVSPTKDIQFDVFKTSKVEIYDASYLDIDVVDGRFRPKANLHGIMNISASLGENESSKKANLVDIAFENLEIQSVKPFIKVGTFSFGSETAEQAMADFPISINDIGLRSVSETEVGLEFDLNLNLTESFGGKAGLTILGELNRNNGSQKWKYDKLQVDEILVDVDQGAFKFYGRLQFFRNDRVYGNGFNGVVDAEFSPGIDVQATAIFGSVDGMRFWYADALASFPSAVPIVPPLGMNGFGGGAYYRMKMDNEGIGSDLGKTASGIVYIPDEDSGLGLKATLPFSTTKSESVINGAATFEIAFYRGGGVRSITFTGNMYLLTPSDQANTSDEISKSTDKMVLAVKNNPDSQSGVLPDDGATIQKIYGPIGSVAGKKGSFSAQVKMVLDFENKSLHANMEMFVNVSGGIIKGVGAGGRAGWAVLHYDPNDWYFYLGTPDDRIGISAGVGPIRAELNSYFMVGTKIPGSPPPPEIVSDILGGVDLDYMKDENALGLGQGFGFGSALAIDTGDLTFLMFYARFQAGLGFDIMLKNYGDDVKCEGRSDPLGVNGWYANGQAYAYFDGKIGIRVKIFGKRKSVDILSIGAAAVLQAKLPNPFWMRGIVGGRFRVLGGLVSGNCKFEVTIGEECEIVGGSVLQGIKVIAEVTPNEGEREVSVFNTPQSVFNMPINKTFEMIDVDDKKKSFRIKLDEFSLVHNGSQIPGDLEWNVEKDVVAFNSFDVFPSEKDITAVVQVSFEEKVSGRWAPVYVSGEKYVERSEATFKSGVAPDYIPLDNVEYSYPVLSQVNYYKGETNTGYIKLEKGQPYLFDTGAEWEQKGRFKSKAANTEFFDFSYSSSEREVTFNIPGGDLQNDKIYSFELINLPAQDGGKIDRNVSSKVNKVINEGVDIDTEVTTKEAEGNIDELQEKSIFTSHIRTSKFNTLGSKLNTADMSQQWRWPIRNGVHELGKAIIIEEVFDNAELNGSNGQEPLIQFEAILSDNRYYNEFMKPLIYDGYPIQNQFKIKWRDPVNKMGVPPVRAIYIRQHPHTNLRLSETNLTSQNYSFYGLTAAFIYNLSHYYHRDLIDMRNQVANYYADSGWVSERLEYMLTTPFPRIIGGQYRVRVKYVMPGRDKVVSQKIITITNPVE